ncbi:MAG: phosphatidylglycerophosphatase A [Fibrobacteria bacterium]|nr:phosphatidylglycerophosphatase A [Fibrobacteria bacterium]
MKTTLINFIGSFCYLGRAPFAPGTFGSAGAALCFWLGLLFLPSGVYPYFLYLVPVLVFAIGWPVCSYIEKTGGKDDPGWVVIDELGGQWLTFWLIPCEQIVEKPYLILIGFGLFRLFDIWKPFFIKKLDAIRGGFGIMADDYLAGFYAAILLFLIARFLPL